MGSRGRKTSLMNDDDCGEAPERGHAKGLSFQELSKLQAFAS